MVSKDKQEVWNAIARFAPQLNKLQEKEQTISIEASLEPDIVNAQYWKKVGDNLADLIKKLDSRNQVCNLATIRCSK